MTFSEVLISHRKRLGWTQARLAAFLGVCPATVFVWEKGSEPMMIAQEGAIARLNSVWGIDIRNEHCRNLFTAEEIKRIETPKGREQRAVRVCPYCEGHHPVGCCAKDGHG